MKTFKISAVIAIIFFTVGTILFLLQLIATDMQTLPIIGLYYVFVAVVLNCIVLLTLIGKLIIEKRCSENLKSIGVIKINIPVALLYIHILFEYKFI